MTNDERLKLYKHLAEHPDSTSIDGYKVEAQPRYEGWTLHTYPKDNAFKMLGELIINADGSYDRYIDWTTLWSSCSPRIITEPDHIAELDTLLEKIVIK